MNIMKIKILFHGLYVNTANASAVTAGEVKYGIILFNRVKRELNPDLINFAGLLQNHL